MAISVVQAVTKSGPSGALQLTGLSTTTGNLFVVAAMAGGAFTSVTDSAGNTYTQLNGSALKNPTYIYATNNATPTAITSVTVTTTVGYGCAFVFYEVSGNVSNTSPQDVSIVSTGTNTSADSGNTLAVTYTGDLAISAVGWDNIFDTSNGTSPTFTSGAGTNKYAFDTEGIGSSYKMSSSYLVLTSATVQKFTMTLSSTPVVGWTDICVLIKGGAISGKASNLMLMGVG